MNLSLKSNQNQGKTSKNTHQKNSKLSETRRKSTEVPQPQELLIESVSGIK